MKAQTNNDGTKAKPINPYTLEVPTYDKHGNIDGGYIDDDYIKFEEQYPERFLTIPQQPNSVIEIEPETVWQIENTERKWSNITSEEYAVYKDSNVSLRKVYKPIEQPKERGVITKGHVGGTPPPGLDKFITIPVICGENCGCKSGEDCYGEAALNLIERATHELKETAEKETVDAINTKPIKTKPHFYAVCLPEMQRIAKECGYNLIVHGSMNRDFDLVAVPWVDEPESHYSLITKLCGFINGEPRYPDIEYFERCYLFSKLPGGRSSYVINIYRGGYYYGRSEAGERQYTPDPEYYIDISITPSAEYHKPIGDTKSSSIESVEQAAKNYADNNHDGSKHNTAIAGANWQKHQSNQEVVIAELTAWLETERKHYKQYGDNDERRTIESVQSKLTDLLTQIKDKQ